MAERATWGPQAVTPGEPHEQFSWAVSAARWGIAFVASSWVSIPFAIQALVVLMIVDVAISILNPCTPIPAKRLAITLLIVGCVHVIFSMAKSQTGMSLGFEVATPVCLFYCTTEALAIIRVSSPFVQWPPALLQRLQHYEGLSGSQQQELAALSLKQSEGGVDLKLKFKEEKDGR